jgi:hypothetical protein
MWFSLQLLWHNVKCGIAMATYVVVHVFALNRIYLQEQESGGLLFSALSVGTYLVCFHLLHIRLVGYLPTRRRGHLDEIVYAIALSQALFASVPLILVILLRNGELAVLFLIVSLRGGYFLYRALKIDALGGP